MEKSIIFDQIKDIVKNDKVINSLREYYDNYKPEFDFMLKEVMNDPEEADIYRWHIKHFNVNYFLNVWNYVSVLERNIIDKLIDIGYMNYFGSKVNWILISRKFNPDDELFWEYFGERIDKKFMHKYNPKYNENYKNDSE